MKTSPEGVREAVFGAIDSATDKTDAHPGTCGYTGYEFGGGYLDSVCIDGYLWDLDSGDDDGLLTIGGDRPCPKCNPEDEALPDD